MVDQLQQLREQLRSAELCLLSIGKAFIEANARGDGAECMKILPSLEEAREAEFQCRQELMNAELERVG